MSNRKKFILLGFVFGCIVASVSILGFRSLMAESGRYYTDNAVELDFSIIDPEALTGDAFEWYTENYQQRGVHSLRPNEDNRYLLISAGERDDKYEYSYAPVVVDGFKDRINITTFLKYEEKTESNRVHYPVLLLHLPTGDTRQAIAPQTDLFAGLDNHPSMTIAKLPPEEVTTNAVFKGFRLGMAEYILSDDTTYPEEMHPPTNTQYDFNAFSENTLVELTYLFHQGRKTVIEMVPVDEMVLQVRFNQVVDDSYDDGFYEGVEHGISVYVQDEEIVMKTTDDMIQYFNEQEIDSIHEITVRHVKTDAVPDRRDWVEVFESITLN